MSQNRPWSIGAFVVVAGYLAAATWALFTSDIRAFIAALPWSYIVASGPWEGAVVVALFVPCIILNAVLIYAGVAPFLRFTAASLSEGNRG